MNKAINFVKGMVITLTLLVLMPCIAGYIETHYNREGVVIAVNGNEVTVDDVTGNEWIFNGTDYKEGDKVIMKMFTSYTDLNIYDDEIVDVTIIK